MPGQLVHFEVPAGDTAGAKKFYGSLFGWQFQAFEGPTEYHMTRVAEQQGGAIYSPDPPSKRGMRLYFDVEDINADTARVRELGGEAADPAPVPGMGWFSTCKDTEGNEFGLWQNDPNAAPPSN